MLITFITPVLAKPTPTGVGHPADPRENALGRPVALAVAGEVEKAVRRSPALADAVIRCEPADNHRLVLTGHAPTYSTKHAACVLAEEVAGDWKIEDRIDVIPYPAK